MSRIRLALTALAILGAFAIGHAVAQQRHPNINAAQRDLRQALGHLERAPDIFGGHKQRAIELIRGALAELRAAENLRR